MYTKRIQLVNYGPIEKLDIEFPFEGDAPKPIVLVGENGSGKSILLSHIVNGLLLAKGIVYPETPEVETGKVYKIRSGSYIKSGNEYYFAKIDFEEDLSVREMGSRILKRDYEATPIEPLEANVQDTWNRMQPERNDYFDSGFSHNNKHKIEDIFDKNCVLYFPPNRFEEPAWLNEENLKAQAQYMDLKHLRNQTDRRVINHSPLHGNQNWLFELIYDRAAFEMKTRELPVTFRNDNKTILVEELIGYYGQASNTYNIALQIVRTIMRRYDVRFGIGPRRNRVVSITSDSSSGSKELVPNIFQLSSGETSLLNLFLSILRDFDLCGTSFSQAADIRGIVVVDEIDLHLHAVHQNEVLLELIKMFPKVQFIVTTHSPLFVLGMQRAFGEEGFALYRLPQGRQISPEEFSEFGEAYQAFTATSRFSDDIREAIERAQRPIVFVEGTTDQKYLQRASELLGKEPVLERFEIRDGGGAGKLSKIWKDSILPLTETLPQKVLLLFDCDKEKASGNKGKLFQRTIPLQTQNPIKKGVENLFSKETLEKARQNEPAFIDVDPGRTKTVSGEPQPVPEQWTVNENEKTNLCNWLCENGTKEDFQDFQVLFEILEDLLGLQVPQEEAAVGPLGDSESLIGGNGTADLE